MQQTANCVFFWC